MQKPGIWHYISKRRAMQDGNIANIPYNITRWYVILYNPDIVEVAPNINAAEWH